MSIQALSLERLVLKEPTGWFAAGRSFRQALRQLSDGAFKLFVHICLEADRKTGRLAATQKELAAALGKSKRIIGHYVAELGAAQVCTVTPARNQYAQTRFEICDAFWPYRRSEAEDEPAELRQYVESVRECYLTLGACASGSFGAADNAVARDLYERRIPLGVVCDAMLTGACRKYVSWLNGAASEPIWSVRYFESVITEIQEQPLPPGYSSYLRRTVERLAAQWVGRNTGEQSSARDRTEPKTGVAFPQTADLLGKKSNQRAQILRDGMMLD